jgi:hypothetical protein
MALKQITVLGTYHQVQRCGHPLNAKFASVISLIREHHPVQVILEEWLAAKQSFASTLATSQLQWANVGSPEDDPAFETYSRGLNCHPPTHEPSKPMLQEYGPVDVQELREHYMVVRISAEMQQYSAGLFIVGLAHLHSMLVKLEAAGFDVHGYSWIEQT